MRRIIAGNWKMNMTPSDAVVLADGLRVGIDGISAKEEIVICPPFVALSSVFARIAGSRIQLGAQNVYFETKGAFTGETSVEMLRAVGCSYVIIGHSERRHVLGETDVVINRKLIFSALNAMKPIFCIGETLDEREKGLTMNVVERQLRLGLFQYPVEYLSALVIAYEPVWAIGTGKTATPEQAQQVHAGIRVLLHELFPGKSNEIPLLYGGSVTPDNARVLMSQPDINGVLVGGASLKTDSFLGIIRGA